MRNPQTVDTELHGILDLTEFECGKSAISQSRGDSRRFFQFPENHQALVVHRLGQLEIAARIRDISIRLYERAAAIALAKGLIIADTKFEFGLDAAGELVLMDEVLTPDSSRYWPLQGHREGGNPPSFDKQYLRDWLETAQVDGQPWGKKAPAPTLPPQVIEQTAARYRQALQMLTG